MPKQAPYMRFFTGDWMGSLSVRSLSLAARGLYIDLLCVQWDQGSIPADPSALVRAMGWSVKEFAAAWKELEPMFPQGEDGLRRNARCEDEKAHAESVREKAKETGRLGGRPKKQEPNGGETETATKPNGNRTVTERFTNKNRIETLSAPELYTEPDTSPPTPPSVGPTVAEVAAAIRVQGFEPDESDDLAAMFCAVHEPSGWVLDGEPIRHWPLLLQAALPGLIRNRFKVRQARSQGQEPPARNGPRIVTAAQLEASR